MKPVTQRKDILRWMRKSLGFLVITGASLFIAAGSLDWRQAWVYLGLMAFVQILNALVLIPTNPELVAERSQIQEGTKAWDRLLVSIVAIFGPLAICIVAGLDWRLGWSLSMSFVALIIGLVFILMGSLLALWAMASNRFFAATVRIQTDRNHTVVVDGPYRYVRHPGYLGGLLYDLGAPLALGSFWTFVPAALLLIANVLRTALEDRTLLKELNGYTDYARRVRYRLIPAIW